MTAVSEYLGKEAKDLLEYKAKGVSADHLHLPGPDFVDRVCALSDRPTPVLRSLQSIFDHGRLGGTGYLSILPVDQRSVVCAEPDIFRSREHHQTRDRRRLQRRRVHVRRARLVRPKVRP